MFRVSVFCQLVCFSLFFASACVGQTSGNQGVLVFKDGTQVGGEIGIKAGIDGRVLLILDDSVEVEISEVKSFETSRNFFATFRKEGLFGEEGLLKRTYHGKRVELFSEFQIRVIVRVIEPGFQQPIEGFYDSDYFTKDKAPAKPISYHNLAVVLSENKNSANVLRDFRKKDYVAKTFIFAGFSSMGVGFSLLTPDIRTKKAAVAFVFGGFLTYQGLRFAKQNSRKLIEAILCYEE